MPLHHYVVVRRDLPLGVVLAMVTHAAGESFYALRRRSSMSERAPSKREVGGSIPPDGFNPSETIAVVLGARNENKLQTLLRRLQESAVPHVGIVETEGELAGHLLAIGLVPGEKDEIAPHVREFHMIEELEPRS